MRSPLIIFIIGTITTLIGSDNASAQLPAAAANLRPFVYGLTLSLDGETVLTCGDRIRIYESATGMLMEEKDFTLQVSRKFGDQIVNGVGAFRPIRFSTTDSECYATGSDDGTVRLWRLGMKEPERELPLFKVTPEDAEQYRVGHVRDLQFSPDGTLLAGSATILEKGEPHRTEVKLWKIASGEELHSITLPGMSGDGLAFSPHGAKLAIARSRRIGRKSEGSIEIYDVPAWQSIREIPIGAGFANGLAYTSDGESLWLAGGDCIPSGNGCAITGYLKKVVEDGSQPVQLIATDTSNYFRNVSISNDGETFVTGTSALQSRLSSSGASTWTTPPQIGEVYGASLSAFGDKAAYVQMSQIIVVEASTGKRIQLIKVAGE